MAVRKAILKCENENVILVNEIQQIIDEDEPYIIIMKDSNDDFHIIQKYCDEVFVIPFSMTLSVSQYSDLSELIAEDDVKDIYVCDTYAEVAKVLNGKM